MSHRQATAKRRSDAPASPPPLFRASRALDAIATTALPRAPLMREIDAAADYLRYIRRELAALGANELAKGQIPAAAQELDYIIEDCAEVSNVIMTAAEQVMAERDMEPEAFRAFVAERMTTVILQCAVQDISAQRARRIQAVLATIERRLARIATFIATRDMPEIVDFEPELPGSEPYRPMIGPAPRGAGNDQESIDRLLALPHGDD
jgi:chemotaxis protein CheZ